MKILAYILLIYSAPVLAQNNNLGNQNNTAQGPTGPQQTNGTVSNLNVNPGNDLNPIDVNYDNNVNANTNNNFHPYQGNKFQTTQVNDTNDGDDQKENNPDKDVDKKGKNGKPYCKECEEIEKLKKQHMQEHYSSDAYGQKKRNHYVKHICFSTHKKLKKVFGKKKKARPNYSCFNW